MIKILLKGGAQNDSVFILIFTNNIYVIFFQHREIRHIVDLFPP